MSQYLTVALDAAKNAETVILKYLAQGVHAELKADQSPVTIADKEAEEIIKQTIREAFPDHTFYGEEGEKTDLTNHKGFTWIIDPIDGTKNYVRGIPLFATLIALMHDGELILGVSNAPRMHELMHAEKGSGAFLNGKPVHVSAVDALSEAYVANGSAKYFVRDKHIDQLLELSQDVRWARGIGDFWCYHLLAQGKIEAMLEAEIKIWDIAALAVIVREAGGRISELGGSEISPSTHNVLVSNGPLHAELLARLQKP